jgi:predicted RNA binding protein YcfA (HicA-like mRNA interferase family)
MPKLTPLKASEIIRKLRVLGFEGPIPGGRHVHMVHHTKKKIIPIPTHGNKDIGIGLLRKIIRETEVTVEEWQEL